MQMIENSDRGITLNKPLAWSMAGGLVAAGLYFGTAMATLTGESRQVRELIGAQRVEQVAIEVRMRAVEVTTTRQDARFDSLNQAIEELKSAQRQTNDLLRGLRAPKPTE